jgi:hypothetical protein
MEGGGFPDDAGGLAIDCWLQQADQVSNWSTGLLMRRRVSLALHVRLFNNRGACAGACVYVCVYVVLMEMMLMLLSLDNDSICCAALLVAPTLTATNVNRAEPRYLFSSQHRHQAIQPGQPQPPASKHALALSPLPKLAPPTPDRSRCHEHQTAVPPHFHSFSISNTNLWHACRSPSPSSAICYTISPGAWPRTDRASISGVGDSPSAMGGHDAVRAGPTA